MDRGAIETQLDQVLSSKSFVPAPQLCRLLRFLVEQEIAGNGDQLKEYVLGVQALRKDESFDPRIDTAVRTEARRLRQRLAEYYQAEGREDAIEIALPKGSYRPAFQTRIEPPAAPVAAPAKKARVPFWITAGVAAVVAGAAGWGIWQTSRTAPHTPSITVLPLESLSADPEQEYFSDGLTDALFTDLAKFPGLSVVSRTSAMQYKRTKKTIPQIARELKVDYVVEGTVTRVGDRVRISAQLIAAPTDRHIWAESYERAAADTLSLQGELAQAIADQVHIHLTPPKRAGLGGQAVAPEEPCGIVHFAGVNYREVSLVHCFRGWVRAYSALHRRSRLPCSYGNFPVAWGSRFA